MDMQEEDGFKKGDRVKVKTTGREAVIVGVLLGFPMKAILSPDLQWPSAYDDDVFSAEYDELELIQPEVK